MRIRLNNVQESLLIACSCRRSWKIQTCAIPLRLAFGLAQENSIRSKYVKTQLKNLFKKDIISKKTNFLKHLLSRHWIGQQRQTDQENFSALFELKPPIACSHSGNGKNTFR